MKMRLAAVLGLSLLLCSVSGHPGIADNGAPPAPVPGIGTQAQKAASTNGTLTLFTAPFNQKAIEIKKGDLTIEAQTTNLLEPENVDRVIISAAGKQSRIDLDAMNRPSRMEISDDLIVAFQYLKGNKVKLTATRFDGFASETKTASFKLPSAAKGRSAGSRVSQAPQEQTGGVSITARLQACPAPYRHPMPEDVRFAVRYISPGIGQNDISKVFSKGSSTLNVSFDLLQLKKSLRDRDKTKSEVETVFNFACEELASLGTKGACKKALGDTCGKVVTSLGDAICGEFEKLTEKVDKVRKSEINGINGSFDALPSFNYPDSSGNRVTVNLTPFRYKFSEGLKKIDYVLVPNCFSRYQGAISLSGRAEALRKLSNTVVCRAQMSFAGRLQLTVPQSGLATFLVEGNQRLESDSLCQWSDESAERFSGNLPVSGNRIDLNTPDLTVGILLSPVLATGSASVRTIIFEDEEFLQTGEMGGPVEARAY